MEAELAALATSGATVLVQQMVGDGWAHVRDRVAAFFSRADGAADGAPRDGTRRELDRSRDELIAARDAGDEEAVADVQAGWRARLRSTLRADPQLAGELRTLLDEMYPASSRDDASIHNTINGGVFNQPVIQAGHIGTVHQPTTPHRAAGQAD
ncbi:hypothetical protein [Streptomyces sp. NPDC050560]|uniref:hypothetical protein n=1 Tax=Streptomyces sp. NPDC050560 TaxID=3365630 RepID=UPI0037B3AA94